jgi:phosphoserine phosphatase
MDYKIYNFTTDNTENVSIINFLQNKNFDILHSSYNNGVLTIMGSEDLKSYEGELKGLGYTFKTDIQSKYIVTVINRTITHELLSSAVTKIANAGLNLISIKKMSGSQETKRCYEFQAHSAQDLNDIRTKLKDAIEELQIDICVIPADFPRENIKLAVFDMDSTLIQCECIDELAKRFDIGEKVSSITAAAMRGEINFNESFTRRMALLEGLSEDVLLDIGESLPLTEGVEHLISTLKQNGYKIALFSGGFYYFANILKEKLGINHVYANNLPIENGTVTGKVEGEIVDGQKKMERLIHVAKLEGLELSQTVAVGDGANDLPMIKTAGLGVAFHAKPLVREEAGLAVSSIGLDGLLYILGISDQ